MKKEEEIAEQFLRTLEMGDPVFEPDGNIPPDFLLAGGRIAVEVRRLNQTNMIHGRPQGADAFSMSIWPALKGILSEYDSWYMGDTYWVIVHYHHDFRRLKNSMKRKIKDALQKFLNGTRDVPHEFPITKSFSLRITKSTPLNGRVFRPAAGEDENSDEIIPLFIDNITYCIQEKSGKVAPYRHKYPKWWLVLVDHLGWAALDAWEEESIRKGIEDLRLFSKLYVIDVQAKLLLIKK